MRCAHDRSFGVVSQEGKFHIVFTDRVQDELYGRPVRPYAAPKVEAGGNAKMDESEMKEVFSKGFLLGQAEAKSEMEKELSEMRALHREFEAKQAALQSSEAADAARVNEILSRLEKDRYKAPSRFVGVCSQERNLLLQCYRGNPTAPLVCMDLVQAFSHCAADAKKQALESVDSAAPASSSSAADKS